MTDRIDSERGSRHKEPILTFRDALGLAMSLADDHAFVHAAVCLDPHHAIIGMPQSEGLGRSPGPLIAAVCDQSPGSVAAVVLATVRPFEPDVVREADLQLFRRSRWALAEVGIDLLDWIETDGDLFRSYAYVTCPALAWPDDPPDQRLEELSNG